MQLPASLPWPPLPFLPVVESSSSTDATSSSSSSSAASTATPTTPTHIPLPASALENGVTHNCGAVEGQGTLFIKESTLPCMEAKGIINIYLNDPSVPHEGEASVAKLGDWTCSTSIPSVAASDGFALSCTRGADPGDHCYPREAHRRPRAVALPRSSVAAQLLSCTATAVVPVAAHSSSESNSGDSGQPLSRSSIEYG
ncbi:MAG: hypothetical protein U1U88_001451 [Lawsonella clevelandensis]